MHVAAVAVAAAFFPKEKNDVNEAACLISDQQLVWIQQKVEKNLRRGSAGIAGTGTGANQVGKRWDIFRIYEHMIK